MKAIEQTKLYGLKNDIRNLINIYDNGKLPNKILISGIKGIGKSIKRPNLSTQKYAT